MLNYLCFYLFSSAKVQFLFDTCKYFNDDNLATVEIFDNEIGFTKYNLLDMNGHLVDDEWFDEVRVVFNSPYGGKIRIVKKKNSEGYYQFNFISPEKKCLVGPWVDSIGNFYNWWAEIQLNGKSNFISVDGKILSDVWFDYFDNDFSCAARGILYGEITPNKWNAMDLNGNVLFGESLNW